MSSTRAFDPSCGNFYVAVRTMEFDNSGSIEIRHTEWVGDMDCNYYSAFQVWDGTNLTVADIDSLLDEARVPTYIQNVSVDIMILQCVHEILEDPLTRFPISIVVSITSELMAEQEEDEEDEEEEEEEEDEFMEIEYFESKPANPEVVNALERVEKGVLETKEECAVCMDDYRVDMRAIRMPCSHLFHEACILRWLESHHVCPLCRFALEP